MDKFEKVEKLVEKAGVSYEDANWALEQANGDLLDAMILLEKIGKAAAPKKSSYSTQYEDQVQYLPVEQAAERGKDGNRSSEPGKFKEFCRKAWQVLSGNFLVIRHHGDVFAKLPLWAVILLLLAVWHVGLVLILVSLFFGFTYQFQGEADMEAANKVMDKASNAAEKVKEEFRK
ncbi:MAG: hypothetical protein J5496_01085 [Lachnospiraceae bacterium]|nr:hypothetical protein [Lachnospiraceae bacterium]